MYSHEQLKLMDAAAISICSQRHIQSVIEELIETALATAPTPAEAPADVARWIDPNDKTQPQYLPHVGERVLFCHDGKTYYGKHTGGSFISFTHPGNTYPTWECHWTYPPKAIDAAMNEKGGA